MEMEMYAVFGLFALIVAVFFGLFCIFLRRVVSTNEVHIVQYRRKTVSYGKDTSSGNVYYEWPHWVPLFGITKVVLPVSVFDLDLSSYEAYDKGRLPFIVDVKAFFRVSDSNIAAQRVFNFEELKNQLLAVVQGAVRTVLASSEIEEIMQGRSKFGDEFTAEVKEQLGSWGVDTVKNIELMDIRDADESQVIHNIMEKKKSLIEMQSRQEVARNTKIAEIAEIEATREVSLETENANKLVGLRKVEVEKQVALAQQESSQVVKEQEKVTAERDMEVVKVKNVRKAEIEKEMAIINATKEKEAAILVAEAKLETTKRNSEGIRLEGEAKANAEKAMQLAPIEAQTVLAKEIGANKEYQQYLISIESIQAGKEVGLAQASALVQADVKVIVNSDNPNSGLTKVLDIFSSKGGVQIGAMLEGLAQTKKGEEILSRTLN